VFLKLLQTASQRTARPRGLAALRYLGALGLFLLAVVDSLPLPTLAGPDILIAVLAARHRDPWFEYVAVASAGSLLGAYITFRLARRAGMAYIESKFRRGRLPSMLRFFRKQATGALVASTAIPFPFPTSVLFAAAGASEYDGRKFLILVALCRLLRYSVVALVAQRYGRYFIRVLRHPTRDWGWLLLMLAVAGLVVLAWILGARRRASAAGSGARPHRGHIVRR
jgi:membrane protein YqaA with SNARE-associated domain